MDHKCLFSPCAIAANAEPQRAITNLQVGKGQCEEPWQLYCQWISFLTNIGRGAGSSMAWPDSAVCNLLTTEARVTGLQRLSHVTLESLRKEAQRWTSWSPRGQQPGRGMGFGNIHKKTLSASWLVHAVSSTQDATGAPSLTDVHLLGGAAHVSL